MVKNAGLYLILNFAFPHFLIGQVCERALSRDATWVQKKAISFTRAFQSPEAMLKGIRQRPSAGLLAALRERVRAPPTSDLRKGQNVCLKAARRLCADCPEVFVPGLSAAWTGFWLFPIILLGGSSRRGSGRGRIPSAALPPAPPTPEQDGSVAAYGDES